MGLDRSNLTDLLFAFGDLYLLWRIEGLRVSPAEREGKRGRASVRIVIPRRRRNLGSSWPSARLGRLVL